MKAIHLNPENTNFSELFQLAQQEPLLLVADDGKEFILSEADDFETEVETLRNSQRFQEFLDRRSQNPITFSLDEIEQEIDAELNNG
ncbi:MAG: hypothetical protein ACPGVO_03835 [Spirulinaceae cyanobacterium]